MVIHNLCLFVVSVAILNEVEALTYNLDMVLNNAGFNDLLERMDKMEVQGTLLQAENEGLKRRIELLETTVAEQQGVIIDMKETIKVQTEVNQKLHERLMALEGKHRPIGLNGLDQRMANIYNQTDRVLTAKDESHTSPLLDQGARKDNKHLKQNLETGIPRVTRRENEATVAFFARLDNHINNPGVHQIIAFDHVVTNVGNSYNAHAGDFRAPVAGIYVFSTTMKSASSTLHYHFKVMHNANAVANMTIPHGGTASMEVVLQLNQGDDVSIHNIDGGQKVFGHGYSTFSGFLLQQDYPNIVVGK